MNNQKKNNIINRCRINAENKLNFSITNWPADLFLKHQNMYSNNILALNGNRVSPSKATTVYKYSQTLISLL